MHVYGYMQNLLSPDFVALFLNPDCHIFVDHVVLHCVQVEIDKLNEDGGKTNTNVKSMEVKHLFVYWYLVKSYAMSTGPKVGLLFTTTPVSTVHFSSNQLFSQSFNLDM